MNKKAEKFNAFMKEHNITCFNAQDIGDKLHTVLYHSFMEVSGQKLPTMVVLDDCIYAMLRVYVAAGVVKEANRTAVLEHLNKLNEKYKVFKYYVNESGDIVIESCITTTEDDFVPGIINIVIEVVLKHLIEEYPQIMKIVWAN